MAIVKSSVRSGFFRRFPRLRADMPAEEEPLVSEPDLHVATEAEVPTPEPEPVPSAEDAETIDPPEIKPPSRSEQVAEAVGLWRSHLVDLGGDSALANLNLLGQARLDISHAHPSGVAQLFAGRPTRLSNLIRDPARLATARKRAHAVTLASSDLAQRFGVAPSHLAIGIARWDGTTREELLAESADQADMTHTVRGVASWAGPLEDSTRTATSKDPDATRDVSRDSIVTVKLRGNTKPRKGKKKKRKSVRFPVLLRPLRIEAQHGLDPDYILTLEDRVEINPVLVRVLRRHGAFFDPQNIALQAFSEGAFDPVPVLSELRTVALDVLGGFDITDSLLIGSFMHPGQSLVDDLDASGAALGHHEVIAALAGVPSAVALLEAELPPMLVGDRDPDSEPGAGDLSPDQVRVLDAAATGAHLFVDAPPGSDVPGTIAALAAQAARSGRSALYVAAHRRSAEAVQQAISASGLDDLVLDTYPASGTDMTVFDLLLESLTRLDDFDPAAVERIESENDAMRYALVNVRAQLSSYIAALHAVRQPWQVSAYQALQALADLTLARPAPRTTVRLPSEVVRALTAEHREHLRESLTRAADLGAFDVTSADSAWFGANIASKESAARAVELLEQLLNEALPALTKRLDDVSNRVGIDRALSLGAWGEQLTMFAGLRDVLDVFQPIVFERSVADMIVATATKEWRAEQGIDMGRRTRRHLQKTAQDMMRPGHPATDLHAELVKAQQQRSVWLEHCSGGGWPQLPPDLVRAQSEYHEVLKLCQEFGVFLEPTPENGDLVNTPLRDVKERLLRLYDDRAALTTLPERTSAVRVLREAGLEPLLVDLANRRVHPRTVGRELDLAWWSSVFEAIMREEPALAGYDGPALRELGDRFRELDEQQIHSLGTTITIEVAKETKVALEHHKVQSAGILGDLMEGKLASLRDAMVRYPDIVGRLRPMWLTSPLLVPQISPGGRVFDVVIIDAGQDYPVAEAIAAISRGHQVIVIGDPRRTQGGIVQSASEVLPSLPLNAEHAARDPRLSQFLATHGYEGQIRPLPLPTASGLLRLEKVDGTGMAAPDTQTIESIHEEVERVVDLVIDHALSRTDESLAVVALNARHAQQIREAIAAEMHSNPSLAYFFSEDQIEPFTIVDVANTAGLSRDAVIISIGFARTPHGRVLHQFGKISDAGGDGLLLGAIAAARRSVTVVTNFGAQDLLPERLRTGGSRLLRDFLHFMEKNAEATAEPSLASPDPLLVDLAERVWRMGLEVAPSVGVDSGLRVPLAISHPDLSDRMLVAVLTDDAAYVAEPSERVRNRQNLEVLARAGWCTTQVWAAAAFIDPQSEAERLFRITVEERDRILGPSDSLAAPLRETLPAELMDQEEYDTADISGASAVAAAIWGNNDRADFVAESGVEEAESSEGGSEPSAVESGIVAAAHQEANADGGDEAPAKSAAEIGDGDKVLSENDNIGAAKTPAMGESAASEIVSSEIADAGNDSVQPASAEVDDEAGHGEDTRVLQLSRSRRTRVRPTGSASEGRALDVQTPHMTHNQSPAELSLVISSEQSGPSASLQHAATSLDPTHMDVVKKVIAGQPETGESYEPRVMPSGSVDESLPAAESATAGVSPKDETASEAELELPEVAATRVGPRPAIVPGLPITGYTESELDLMLAWIESDGVLRTKQEIADLLRCELGISRRNIRVDLVVRAAIDRRIDRVR